MIPIATAPTPRTQALARALAQVVREQRVQDPSLAAEEVQAALTLAKHELAAELGGGPSRLLAIALAAGAGVLVLLAGLAGTRF